MAAAGQHTFVIRCAPKKTKDCIQCPEFFHTIASVSANFSIAILQKIFYL